ncbi:virulence RhuM family protein [Campylobacter sp. 2018MI13]|uniref:virulence RhuM family protein n=1 Tax=Campylobacter sp. 2018MI13 TaxID=2836737 RepID=UPI001BD9E55B|nr:virulence RhuM family protein [Campylobacter sp. 2018MI13]MBT0882479.1 virulence RhuM family protein [Campylobacter sp. 2018MI13]
MQKNMTIEFLSFSLENQADFLDVVYKDENIWLSVSLMAKLFECSNDNINLHLKNIYNDGELDRFSTTEDFSVVQKEGSRGVKRTMPFYNLDAIISVGYRINSSKATQFRKWATQVLKEFSIKGYVLDKERLKNGGVLTQNYFDELLEEIREIRASERMFYQKITDIYATSIDYNKDDKITKDFFAQVQNKLHYAIHQHTAAELIKARANANMPHMGLTSWKNAPNGKILLSDVVVAKNYLTQEELGKLNRLVTMYLDYAEDRAKNNQVMTMQDWKNKLDSFLEFNEREILKDFGKISKKIADDFAKDEFNKFRVRQDREYISDFDKEVAKKLKGQKCKTK